ncbi:MAG: hypothetical protein A3A61_02975 [Candidatus Woykebacteria bacterium RIFCSPLOWO2_01_FULL_43_14]|uniref:DUF5667 domain-containing protein n=1 Tax=Candidatus Woykebacteria bacterium RIFCSPLOWO2_01_FULL_43_14 TaxID=1802605 RepID=A0A1G1WWX3_9BACT|nr:MAG: hypothetical protein A3A61_02975 [Candidatus Woykebacteria bacterium RIFCSPLOWO2_01_FULL_43_14]
MPKITLITLVASTLFFSFVFSVSASNSRISDFYDWGPWYYKGSNKVLGESTSLAQATPTDSTTSASPEASPAPQASQEADQADVSTATGLLPDSPFYFFKPFTENIRLTFTFDARDKESLRLEFAEERLAETKALLEKKDYNRAADTLERYEGSVNTLSGNLEQLQTNNTEIEDLAKEVELNTAKHSLVLEKLDLIVPEEVKDDISLALVASQNGMDVTADILGYDPIPTSLKERLESLKALGILSEEEIASIFTIKSRGEVRGEMERLVQENILPDADIKNLDQAQYGYFPADFLRSHEVRKLFEYKRLEELKPDEATQKRISEFSSDYTPGDAIPSELRRWWMPVQRYQELSSTLRPDLIINVIIPRDGEEYKRFENIFNRFKPSEDQLKSVEQWVKDHPGQIPPPDIQRIASLAVNLGTPGNWQAPEQIRNYTNTGYPSYYPAQPGFSGPGGCKTAEECRQSCESNPGSCGPGYTSGGQPNQPSYPGYGGYPNASGGPGSYCLQSETKARNSFSGEIKSFPNSCIPSGWYPYYGSEKSGDVAKPSYFYNQPIGEPYPSGSSYSSFACTDSMHCSALYSGGKWNINCYGGWENKDGNISNGCESSTGSGGSSSPYPSTSTGPTSCASGWENRDGNWNNGCEYYNSSTSGTSGTGTYTYPSASSYSSFACTESMHCSALYSNEQNKWNITCSGGWENRDGNDGNGCEVATGSTSTSPSPSSYTSPSPSAYTSPSPSSYTSPSPSAYTSPSPAYYYSPSPSP